MRHERSHQYGGVRWPVQDVATFVTARSHPQVQLAADVGEQSVTRIVAVSGRLHRPVAGATPGPGWEARRTGVVFSRQFLLDQFSPLPVDALVDSAE